MTRVNQSVTTLITALLLSGFSIAAHAQEMAQWTLDNDASRLSFISVKATDVGEVHAFTSLHGTIAADGNTTVTIDLASVETLIPIRNERMQEILFETGLFPTATITARLDPAVIATLPSQGQQSITVEATLTLKGKTVPLTLQLVAAGLADGSLLVTSTQPLIVTAAMLGLTEGVEQLREIAGLPSISQAVPVSFVLSFQADAE